jgi:hypothetical protein
MQMFALLDHLTKSCPHAPHAHLVPVIAKGHISACGQNSVQADLIYMPFMERFAIAMPAFTLHDPCDACDGRIGEWLAAMRQLECCQMAAPDQNLFLQALK